MKNTKGKFTGTGGLELFYQAWLPEKKLRAIIVIVHGVHEHCGRYMNLVNTLVPKGFGFYGFDLRGHGRSQGRRGHINHFSEYREDVRTFVKLVREKQPRVPVFLFAHSLGALIGVDFLERFPSVVDGAIISGGPFEPAGVSKPMLVFIAKTMSHIAPNMSFDLKLDPEVLSRDVADKSKRASDPLIDKVVSARWGTECMRTVDEVWANTAAIHDPILIIHGEDDKLNTASGARKFFKKIAFKDKTLQIYPDTYHEVHNDYGWQILAKNMEAWQIEHI
jgi:alpha-beta hydrolase superfamily lysophospholipase